MLVPDGMRYLNGTEGSSVRNQPPIATFVPVGLYSSMASNCGRSVCARISLMTMGGMAGSGSSAPGEPPGRELARHEEPLSEAWEAPATRGTSEKPNPSAVTGQGARSPQVKEKTFV